MGDIVTWQQTDDYPTLIGYSAIVGEQYVDWIENYCDPRDKIPWRANAECTGEAWFPTLAEAKAWVESEVKGEEPDEDITLDEIDEVMDYLLVKNKDLYERLR